MVEDFLAGLVGIDPADRDRAGVRQEVEELDGFWNQLALPGRPQTMRSRWAR